MLLGQFCTTEQFPASRHASKCNGGKDLNVLGFPFPWAAQQAMSCHVPLTMRIWLVARFHRVDLAGIAAAEQEVGDPQLVRTAWPCASALPSFCPSKEVGWCS